MSVDVQAEILIAAPREKVAEFMFDAKYDKLWISGLVSVFPLTPGKLCKGSKVQRIGDFMNKRFDSMVVVVAEEPGRMLELSIDEPFEMLVKYTLSDAAEGTSVKIRLRSVGDIPFKTPAAVLSKAVLDKLNLDLKRLKKLVEENN
ncbi:MAG: hypothetical protein N2Z23_01865 [Pyrinomonadaceae bacterium]|nr:hypothetical protein [Pyrinomonadaceae bacterium]MCX7639176.1 hypothetical protein [Pyrinomonadaceae bacterium]MDW8303603.1 hypothetical protein [Acidobacteriota bacterium]